MPTLTHMVILFRGRNTSAILADAARFGLVPEGAQVVTVCREGDALAEPGDLPSWSPPPREWHGVITVIGNGGTTAQQAPLLCLLAATAARSKDWAWQGRSRGMDLWHAPRSWAWRVVEVTQEGVTHLVGDTRNPTNWTGVDEPPDEDDSDDE